MDDAKKKPQDDASEQEGYNPEQDRNSGDQKPVPDDDPRGGQYGVNDDPHVKNPGENVAPNKRDRDNFNR